MDSGNLPIVDWTHDEIMIDNPVDETSSSQVMSPNGPAQRPDNGYRPVVRGRSSSPRNTPYELGTAAVQPAEIPNGECGLDQAAEKELDALGIPAFHLEPNDKVLVPMQSVEQQAKSFSETSHSQLGAVIYAAGSESD